MRPAVLHLRDLRVGIVWMRPVVVRGLLLPFPIDPRQVGTRRCSDPGRFGERGEKLLIALAAVAAHDAPQGRVRFQRRGVDPDRLTLHQVGRTQTLQNPGKHGPMRFERDQAPRPRNRRVVWRRLVQPDAQKIAQRQRIRGAPSDAALRVDAFEIADQKQPEIDARGQAGPTHRLGVKGGALRFSEIVEAVLAQQLIQPPIKRMAGGRRQVRRRNPHRRLSIACARAHRHGRSVVRDVERVDQSTRAARGPHHRGCSAMFQSVATAGRPLPTHLMPMSAAERRRSASCAP